MQIRLTLIIFIMLTACVPVPLQSIPTTAPMPSESAVAVSESPPATASELPQYKTSVLAALWDNNTRTTQILPVEPSSGQAVPGYPPIAVGVNFYHAFSPDRKTLVMLGYKSDNSREPILYNVDLTSWHETNTQLDITGWAGGLAFSPDGKFVVIGLNDRQSTLLVFDIEKNQVLARATPDFEISHIRFTSGGSALIVYGKVIINRFTANEQTSGFAKMSLFDAQTLNVLWSVELEGVREGVYPADENSADTTNLNESLDAAIYLYPGLVFAPDRANLYIVHADEDRLTTVDFEARSVSTVSIQPKLSWLERILLLTSGVAHAKMANGTSRSAVISPDGTTIYTIGSRNGVSQSPDGDWIFTGTSLGLQAIDTSDGTERFKLDLSVSDLKIMPDGSSLLLHSWGELPFTTVLDAETLQVTSRFGNAIVFPAQRMNGRPVLLSAVTLENETHMSAYSMEGELLGEWLTNGIGAWLIAP
jgi:WD40 repeat protein